MTLKRAQSIEVGRHQQPAPELVEGEQADHDQDQQAGKVTQYGSATIAPHRAGMGTPGACKASATAQPGAVLSIATVSRCRETLVSIWRVISTARFLSARRGVTAMLLRKNRSPEPNRKYSSASVPTALSAKPRTA